MEAENMRDPRELALENRPKTYRITVEAIGPEVDLMNNGAPHIIETDGFFIIGISKMEHDDGVGMGFDIVTQHVSPMDIAKGVLISDHAKEIQEAMMLERMLRKFKEAGA